MRLLYCTQCNCLTAIDPIVSWGNECHCRKSFVNRDTQKDQLVATGPCKIVILADKDFKILEDGKTGTVKMQIIKEPDTRIRRAK